MKRCLQITQLASEENEAELSMQDRLAVNLHLLACKNCRTFKRNTHILRKIMQQYAQGGLPVSDGGKTKPDDEQGEAG